MSEIKWIKLSTSMFDDEKIRVIERMPEADTILVIWLKLLTMAGKVNAGGFIMLTETVPYTEDMLVAIVDRPIATVRMAIQCFEHFGMIERWDDGRLYLPNWEKHQNIDGLDKIRAQTRDRVAKHRERLKQLTDGSVTSNVTVTHGNAIDKEEDKEKEKEIKHIVDSDECNNAFEQFWSLYPSKTGKKPALKKWVSLWKDNQIDMQTVIEGTKRYIKYVEHRRSTGFQLQHKNGSTFVSQECWNDEYQIPEVDHGTTGESAKGAYPGIDFGF